MTRIPLPLRELDARASVQGAGRVQAHWPGWAERRRKARRYFLGVSAGALVFAVAFRLLFPHYREVQVQFALLQFCVIAVLALWFVPALVRDFDASLERPGLRLRPGMVSASLGGLFGNIVYLSFLASFSLLPLVLMLPPGMVVSRYYYELFRLPWGLHVLVLCFVMASFLVMLLGAGSALLLIIRSIALYRALAFVVLLASVTGITVVVNALVASGLRGIVEAMLEPYMNAQVGGGYLNHVRAFESYVDQGSFLLSVIHNLWLRILIQLLVSFVFAGIISFILLGLAALVRSGADLALRRFQLLGWRWRRGGPLAPPGWALVTSLALMGAAALALFYNTNYLQGEEMARVQAGTPFALLWLGMAAAAGYVVVASWSHAVCVVDSGLGGGLRSIMRRFLSHAGAYGGCTVLAGLYYLSVLARVEQRPWAELAAAAAAMVALVLAMLAVGAGLLVLWRVRQELVRRYASVALGAVVGFGAGVVSYVSFLLDPPERLFGSAIAPAEAAPRIALEAARLGQMTYTSVFHAWTGGLSRVFSGDGAAVMALIVTVALAAAAAAVLAASLRLSRRIA